MMNKQDQAIRDLVAEILAPADVRIDGDRPWDLKVRHPGVLRRALAEGSLGLGESYMDGWWDCEELDVWATKIFRSRLDQNAEHKWRLLWLIVKSRLFNLQKDARASRSGAHPYGFGEDLFRAMLDRRMTYSCAYWARAADLDTAQEAKLDLVCRKIDLREGQTVLDIGCGWGSFARFAAERYGARVTGITVSPEQAATAREVCRDLPVEIRLADYRSLGDEVFDHVVSIGMFEHVGYKNYAAFMRLMARCVSDDGLILLHTIGRNRPKTSVEPWIDKYVFPNAMLPSASQLAKASEEVLIAEDWHNFSVDYDRTLMAWWQRFDDAWPELSKSENYDERFYRMWRFYLLGCAGRFRARRNQLWQIVYSKRGVEGGYRSVR